jgi:hypothetical protein
MPTRPATVHAPNPRRRAPSADDAGGRFGTGRLADARGATEAAGCRAGIGAATTVGTGALAAAATGAAASAGGRARGSAATTVGTGALAAATGAATSAGGPAGGGAATTVGTGALAAATGAATSAGGRAGPTTAAGTHGADAARGGAAGARTSPERGGRSVPGPGDGRAGETRTKPRSIQLGAGVARRRSARRRSDGAASCRRRRSSLHRRSNTTPRRSGRARVSVRRELKVRTSPARTTKRYGGGDAEATAAGARLGGSSFLVSGT